MSYEVSRALESMADNNGKLHFAMFPWLAFGHMIPFLELSKSIAEKGHKVSFISTPRNIDRLPKLPPSFSSSITFVKIPFPKLDELPENAEATADIRSDDMPYLKKAFDGLETELTRFLENSLPDWIIYDFSPHWLPSIAGNLGISRAFFAIINAWFVSMPGPTDVMINGSDYRTKPEDFTVAAKWVPFETKVAYRLHEIKWLFGSTVKQVTGVSDQYRSGKVISGSDAIIIRHSLEFEGQWLNLLQDLHNKPVIPLGLMPPSVFDNDDDTNQTWINVISAWFDSQTKGSVVYVALGSEVILSQEQLNELALGLELSNLPFFWALRKPSGSIHEPELPEGFEERVKDRGLVWKSWAPQLKILSHDSVGGFLTHCGWSSVIEGVLFGQPLIMLPFLLDQPLNARVFEEKGLGVEIPRDEEDGSYTRDSVAETVKLVMVENDGKKFREKAKEMSAVFGDLELHNQYIENALQFFEMAKHSPK